MRRPVPVPILAVLAAVLAGGGALAGEFPSGEGRKVGLEAVERLTALGKEISALTPEDRTRLEQQVIPAPRGAGARPQQWRRGHLHS